MDNKKDDDIIIASGNPDDPTGTYTTQMVPNEEQNTIIIPEESVKARNTPEDTLLVNSAMASAEFTLKTKAIIDTYKDRIHEFRKKNPEKWKEFLNTALAEYKKDPMHLEMMIELLAISTIDFQEQLKDGTTISPISEQLEKLLAE